MVILGCFSLTERDAGKLFRASRQAVAASPQLPRPCRTIDEDSRGNYAASLCSASKCAGTWRKSQTSPHQESIFSV